MLSPVQQVARKEFIDMTRDGRFRIASAILALLVIVSVTAGYTAHQALRTDRDAAQSQMQDWWYKQPSKNAHRAAHYGLWVFKPAPVLGFIDRGVDPYAGAVVWLEAHKLNDFRFRPAMDATPSQRFGEWSAAAVLQQLVPLLIIILGFDAFAGERESGTLRQVASLGIAPRILIGGKALGIAAALSVILVPTATLGAMALTVSSGVLGADAARLASLVALYLAWFSLALLATLIVSIVARTARQALLVLLAIWSFNALVAPRVASGVGRALHPTPTRVEFQAKIDAGIANGLDGHSPSGKRANELEQALFAEYHVHSRDELPVSFEAAAMQASEEHGNEIFDASYGALYAKFRAQIQMQQWFSVVAPLIGVRLLSMDIAGTDVNQHHAFATAAEEYRRLIARTMNGWLMHNTRDGQVLSSKADRSLWASVSPFTYEIPPLSSTLPFYLPSIVLLIVWLTSLGTWIMTRRNLSVS